MITNATLLRVDAPQPASPTGDVLFTTGPTIAVRCCQDEPSESQKYVLGVVAQDATAVLYVMIEDLADGSLVSRSRVTVQMDDATPTLYQILSVRKFVKSGGLSHFEVMLKGL